MSDRKTGASKDTRITDRIAQFIITYRKMLISFAIIIVAVIVVASVGTIIVTQRNGKAIIKAEELQDLYNEYSQAEDDKKADIRTKIEDSFDELTQDYAKTYGAQRAYFIMANIYWEEEKWELSAEAYESIASKFPDSYLAPVCYLNAAAAFEEMDKTEDALSLYERVIELYKADPSTPKAYFSAARLHETTGNYDEALTLYRDILQEYPTSNWTKFARSRIIQLELGK